MILGLKISEAKEGCGILRGGSPLGSGEYGLKQILGSGVQSAKQRSRMGQGLGWKLRTTILLFMFRYLSVGEAPPTHALGLFTQLFS